MLPEPDRTEAIRYHLKRGLSRPIAEFTADCVLWHDADWNLNLVNWRAAYTPLFAASKSSGNYHLPDFEDMTMAGASILRQLEKWDDCIEFLTEVLTDPVLSASLKRAPLLVYERAYCVFRRDGIDAASKSFAEGLAVIRDPKRRRETFCFSVSVFVEIKWALSEQMPHPPIEIYQFVEVVAKQRSRKYARSAEDLREHFPTWDDIHIFLYDCAYPNR